MSAIVTPFFDEPTFTFSYIVQDPHSNSCAIIDSVLDFDYDSGTTSTRSADALLAHITDHGLKLEWILETHVHADHLSAAPYLKEHFSHAKTGIGQHIRTVQDTFGKVFNAGTEFVRDGSQFDRLFVDGDRFQIGGLSAQAIHTPGHTPACMTYLIGDAAFVGDTLFMPDFGTAAATSPVATPLSSTLRSRKSSPYRTRPDCLCATTTKRRGGTSTPGKPPSPTSVSTISMSVVVTASRISCRCVPNGTKLSVCRG